MADIEFVDNRVQIKRKMNNVIEATLAECAAELVSQTAKNSRVATGQTKGSWQANIRKTSNGHEAVIGSPLENALWEEFGTGEYALKGNGRKGYWVFVKGSEGKSKNTGKTYTLKEAKRIMAYLRSQGLEAYYTNGKKPSRAFWHAYTMLKNPIIQRLQNKLKGEFK